MAVKTAFSTLGCPDWSFDEMIRNGRQYGFDGVEIRLVNRQADLLVLPEFQMSQRPHRRRELADADFAVCGLGSSVRFDEADATLRARQLDVGKAYVELAHDLQAGFVRVFGDVIPVDVEAEQPLESRKRIISQVAEGLQALGEFAAQAKVDILIETHGDFADSRLMQETLNRVDCSAVGILWDTHHPWRFFGETLAETFGRLAPWIRHTHWKDSIVRQSSEIDPQMQAAAGEAHRLMSGHRHADYVLFRGGEFPAIECMQLLIENGYHGWHSLEWEKMWHPEIEDPETALPLFAGKLAEVHEHAILRIAAGSGNVRL